MTKIFIIIYLLIFSIYSFIIGYKCLFETDKKVDKYLSKRSELKRKLDDVFSMSTRESQMFWTRVSGVGAMCGAILCFVVFILIVFGVLTPVAK